MDFQRVGVADLILHNGKAPSWLTKRMIRLGSIVVKLIIDEYGHREFLLRLSNPVWFQALSCALAYDWDSSGTTTVLCGVLKNALNRQDLDVKAVGGKGKLSQLSLNEIDGLSKIYDFSEEESKRLKYASRMTAKIDNVAIQAGYRLYHHMMFISDDGSWAVVQQGMNPDLKTARRFHWLSGSFKSFVVEPHSGIMGSVVHDSVLNTVAKDSEEFRKLAVDLVKDGTEKLKRTLLSVRVEGQEVLSKWMSGVAETPIIKAYRVNPKSVNWDSLKRAYEASPNNYEEFLAVRGVGPSTVKAIALISELVYGVQPSWKDPIKYSFAFGGKDGIPFPVRRREYDEAISFLEDAISKAKLGDRDKIEALKRLKNYASKIQLV
ncbi:DUF763 domain-containing protein [Candidatus Bathyarchaeota archaeon]|nr:DUF763 domain-containing protein [Candidatus Bathyarchaeota archaeon]